MKDSLAVLEDINELGVLLNLEVCARWLLESPYSTVQKTNFPASRDVTVIDISYRCSFNPRRVAI